MGWKRRLQIELWIRWQVTGFWKKKKKEGLWVDVSNFRGCISNAIKWTKPCSTTVIWFLFANEKMKGFWKKTEIQFSKWNRKIGLRVKKRLADRVFLHDEKTVFLWYLIRVKIKGSARRQFMGPSRLCHFVQNRFPIYKSSFLAKCDVPGKSTGMLTYDPVPEGWLSLAAKLVSPSF